MLPQNPRGRAALGDQQFQRILRTLMNDDASLTAIMQLTGQAS